MYGIFTYIWLFLMIEYGKCIGKYTIHGCYGLNCLCYVLTFLERFDFKQVMGEFVFLIRHESSKVMIFMHYSIS